MRFAFPYVLMAICCPYTCMLFLERDSYTLPPKVGLGSACLLGSQPQERQLWPCSPLSAPVTVTTAPSLIILSTIVVGSGCCAWLCAEA